MDELHYREYKIFLRPERFVDADAFEAYWHRICGVAKKLGIDVGIRKHGFHRAIREVLFFDTPNFDLYRNAFILRKRTFFKNGWPQADHELTLKFRHPELEAAASADMHPRLHGSTSAIKFKEELLPLRGEVGGMRSLFSHNCILVSPNIVLDQGLKHIVATFPTLNRVSVASHARLELVNDVVVEELQVEPGSFDFGHGFETNATIAMWRNRATTRALVGEFAFQAKFDRYDAIHAKAKALSEEFYRAMQHQAPDWLQLGTTKTGTIYNLAKAARFRE